MVVTGTHTYMYHFNVVMIYIHVLIVLFVFFNNVIVLNSLEESERWYIST